jgi:hypothetical protein
MAGDCLGADSRQRENIFCRFSQNKAATTARRYRSTLSLPSIDCEFLYHLTVYFYDINYDRSNTRNH